MTYSFLYDILQNINSNPNVKRGMFVLLSLGVVFTVIAVLGFVWAIKLSKVVEKADKADHENKN